MSPHGPIETKPKPITTADVRGWFRAAISRHPKLAQVDLDAAAEEFRAIALRANRVRQGGFLVGGRLRGSGVWKRFVPDDRRLQKHVEIQRDCRRAIAVLIANLPYLAQTSAYDDDHMPDFDRAIEACKVIKKRLAPSNPIKVWHFWARKLRQPITDAWAKAGHKASATSEDSPIAEVLCEAFPMMANDDSVEVSHRAITDFFKEHKD
jgi:hypothetical protein